MNAMLASVADLLFLYHAHPLSGLKSLADVTSLHMKCQGGLGAVQDSGN